MLSGPFREADGAHWSLRASAAGRIPPGGVPGTAPAAPRSAEARHTAGAWRREHAHSARAGTHALTRAAGWAPSNPLREDRLVLLAKSSSGSQKAPSAGGGHGGDGPELGGGGSRAAAPSTPVRVSRSGSGPRAGGSRHWVPAAPGEGAQTGRARHSPATVRGRREGSGVWRQSGRDRWVAQGSRSWSPHLRGGRDQKSRGLAGPGAWTLLLRGRGHWRLETH